VFCQNAVTTAIQSQGNGFFRRLITDGEPGGAPLGFSISRLSPKWSGKTTPPETGFNRRFRLVIHDTRPDTSIADILDNTETAGRIP